MIVAGGAADTRDNNVVTIRITGRAAVVDEVIIMEEEEEVVVVVGGKEEMVVVWIGDALDRSQTASWTV